MSQTIDFEETRPRAEERYNPEPVPDEGRRFEAQPDEPLANGEPEDTQTRQIGRRALTNLVILTTFGAAVWLWILYYTDWVPFTSGLLGLGGLVAWVSFVSSLLAEGQRTALQKALAKGLLEKPRTLTYGLMSGFGILILTSFGSVEIKSFEDSRNRVVIIRPLGQNSSLKGTEDIELARADRYLEAHSTRRVPVPAFWFGRDFEIKVVGLPAQRVRIRGFLQKITLIVPDTFVTRPVVLIRPTARMSVNAEQAEPPLSLTVCRNEEFLGRIDDSDYRGQTVWVGCRVDVEVPSRIRQYWQLEIAQLGQRPEILTRWNVPLAVGAKSKLTAGDRVVATLFKPGGLPYATGNLTIGRVRPGETFAQELQLHYVKDTQLAEAPEPCLRG